MGHHRASAMGGVRVGVPLSKSSGQYSHGVPEPFRPDSSLLGILHLQRDHLIAFDVHDLKPGRYRPHEFSPHVLDLPFFVKALAQNSQLQTPHINSFLWKPALALVKLQHTVFKGDETSHPSPRFRLAQTSNPPFEVRQLMHGRVCSSLR